MSVTEQALPGAAVPSGALVSPGGAQGVQGIQGPTAVSADTGNQAVLGSDGKVFVPDPSPTIWSARLRSYNAISNSTFEVDQRFSGAVATLGTTPFSAGLDRWSVVKAGAPTFVAATQQVAVISPNYPFVPGTSFAITSKVLRVQLTTAQASLAAGDLLLITQQIEGALARELFSDVTSISILARTSGPSISVGVGLRDPATTSKSLVKLCTIPGSAWTLLTCPNIPVFPAGNFVVTPGTPGLLFNICLAAGSNWLTPANDTWQSGGNFVGAVGQTNFAGQPVNTYIDFAFIQLEPGSQCTTLIDCQFTQNYDSCLRYYFKTYNYGTLAGTLTVAGQLTFTMIGNTTFAIGNYPFPKPMAKSPTMSAYNSATGAVNSARVWNTSTDVAVSTVGGNEKGIFSFQLASAQTVPTMLQAQVVCDTGW